MKNTDNRWRIFTIGAFLALFAAMVFFLNGCWAGFGGPDRHADGYYHPGYRACPTCGHYYSDAGGAAPSSPVAPAYAPAPQGGGTAHGGQQTWCPQCNAYH